MKNALLSALWLAFGLAATFYLLPIIEDGIRAAFGGLLTAGFRPIPNSSVFGHCLPSLC